MPAAETTIRATRRSRSLTGRARRRGCALNDSPSYASGRTTLGGAVPILTKNHGVPGTLRRVASAAWAATCFFTERRLRVGDEQRRVEALDAADHPLHARVGRELVQPRLVLVEQLGDLPELLLPRGGERVAEGRRGGAGDDAEPAEVDLDEPRPDVVVDDRREGVLHVLGAVAAAEVLELDQRHGRAHLPDHRAALRDPVDERGAGRARRGADAGRRSRGSAPSATSSAPIRRARHGDPAFSAWSSGGPELARRERPRLEVDRLVDADGEIEPRRALDLQLGRLAPGSPRSGSRLRRSSRRP